MLWIALTSALAIFVVCVAATFVPVRIELTLNGRGEFGKLWAFAAGMRLWFINVAYADALGIDNVLQVYIFSRRLFMISPVGGKHVQKPDEEKMSLGELMDKLLRWRDGVQRWVDPNDLLLFIVSLRRHVRMERFNGRLAYATPDVAITGMISGSLYTIAGLMAPFGTFTVEPQWVDVAKADCNMGVTCKIYPLRVILSAFTFTLKNIKLRQRTVQSAVPVRS